MLGAGLVDPVDRDRERAVFLAVDPALFSQMPEMKLQTLGRTFQHAGELGVADARIHDDRPSQTGQPKQSCQAGANYPLNTPGRSFNAPGSAFNPNGTAGSVYAGNGSIWNHLTEKRFGGRVRRVRLWNMR